MNYKFIDGAKSIDLPQYPDDAWNWLSGKPESGDDKIYVSVAWIYRAIAMIAQCAADLPFALVKGETDVDTSDDWQNTEGFLPDPKRLIYLMTASLQFGKFYLFRDHNKAATKQLRFLIPTSVTPHIDPVKGLDWFERPVAGTVQRFEPVKDIVYCWLPDPRVEVGPPVSYPAKAALSAAGMLYNADAFASHFFERGAIKATILAVPANTPAQERERLEKWWGTFMSGIRNTFGWKVFNADAVKPTVIGEGLEALKDAGAITRAREDIAAAFGISLAMILSSEANYATAVQDKKNLYSNTVLPLASMIAETLNTQVYSPMGLKFVFRPESLEIFQDDEADRAQAWASYVNAGMPQDLAFALLGLDYPAGFSEKDLQPEPVPPALAQAQQEQAEQKPVQAQEPVEPVEVDERPAPSGKASELVRFKRKALTAHKKGKSANVEFIPEYLTLDEVKAIQDNLAQAQSEDDIRAAFVQETKSAETVLEGIRLAVEALSSDRRYITGEK